ncbi:CidA/LrgA family protein [Ancylobacter terrae]|uniref:CidA/LrgA family protein n=1 Tax=Ancylobacter sp. sgz301288 TaxID=3342077 RepID=UPI00385884E4
MSLRFRAARILRRHAPLQAVVVLVFWLVGEGLVRVLGLAVPGAVVGLALLLALLATRRISAPAIRRGADWFLADMLLFFVPAVLAVLDHREFLGLVGLKILFVIVASTAAVMLVTALVVDRCQRWRAAHARVSASLR